MPEIKRLLARGEDVQNLLAPFQLNPLPLPMSMKVQLTGLACGLEALPGALPGRGQLRYNG